MTTNLQISLFFTKFLRYIFCHTVKFRKRKSFKYSTKLSSYTKSNSSECVAHGLPLTSQQLGAGEASTAVWTGTKLPNSHKLSGEPLPRLRQTARYKQCLFIFTLYNNVQLIEKFGRTNPLVLSYLKLHD